MNERIKELAEQAGADFMRRINYNNLEGKEYEEDAGVIFESNESFEKFAELIVRECGYYADIFAAAGCPVDMDPTETAPSDYIKRQFGIKIELPKELK